MGIIDLAELGTFEQYDLNSALMKSRKNFLDDYPMMPANIRKGFMNTM